jgi:glycosyltransferase involved in cell wall biosynthesis
VKILVLASTYPVTAGDATPGFVHELSRRLVTLGHEVDVITPHLPGSDVEQLMDGVRVLRFRYCPGPFEGLVGSGGIVSRLRQRPLRLLLVPPFLLAYLLAIEGALRRRTYDVVHAHWIIPQGLLAALLLPRRRIPFICTAHGGDLFALQSRGFRWLRRLVAARAACVTVVSRYMRDVLEREGLPGGRIEVASMGVDLESRFAPVAGVAREPQRLVFVGRLVEKKGVTVLIDAFARLRATHPATRLTIVGDGPERARLERQAADLGLGAWVEFLGARPQTELPALYSRAAIAVVPSIVDRVGDQEGLGLVTLEAIGCGCAVVASDLAAIRDVIEDGETGLLARAGDAADFATKLRRLLDDGALRAQLGESARTRLMRYDWREVAACYARLLTQATQG